MRPKKTHRVSEEVIQETAQEVVQETVQEMVDPVAQTVELTAPQVLEPDLPSDIKMTATLPVIEAPSTVYVIEPAKAMDYRWIADLWQKHVKDLGAGFEQFWRTYISDSAAGGDTFCIDVCRPAEGFHAYIRQSSGIARRAIAVVNPRQGVGRALLSSFEGKMLRFVVPTDNIAAIAFHDALGCPCQGTSVDGATGKICRIYQGIFPGSEKVVPPEVSAEPEVPAKPKRNWREG